MQDALDAAAEALLGAVGLPGSDQLPWLAMTASLWRSSNKQPQLKQGSKMLDILVR